MKSYTIECLMIILLFGISQSKIENAEPSQEFRGVWSSPWGGDADLVTFISIEQFKKNMTYILDTLKMYKMNSLIYHVRTHNDALYVSELNPVSRYFEKVNFDEFDPLKWLIDETHKRGIDFHAWMNPYRITSDDTIEIETILEKYKNYPRNPASSKDNILYGDNTIIMDPGLENVRTFIADTIIEFLGKYDVEAIHFDDYFYCDMGAKGRTSGNESILIEPDQDTYENYIDNHQECNYQKDNAEDKANWRRDQVDLLIKLLREKITEYNKQNNKYVQFGISPTGIYKNGDGVVTYDDEGTAITTGSDTNGQEHYASYLFCDTVKWCNLGWIDYLLPQSYWARSHPLAHYEKVMGWWDQVLKYKNVNLYSGIGLYMADISGNTYSWKTDYFELYKDLKNVSDYEYVDGASIYNFHTLRTLRDKEDKRSAKQIENGIKAWTKRVPPAQIKSFEKKELEAPQNLEINDGILSFDKVEGAKFYIIYGSREDLIFDSEEILDIIGNPEKNERIEWMININQKYVLGVRAISYSNFLGKKSIEIETDIPTDTTKTDSPSDQSFAQKNIVSIMTLCYLLILLF